MAISRLGEYRRQPATPEPVPARRLTQATRAAISAVLGGVQELIETFDYPELPSLREEIAQCRAFLDSNDDSPALDPAITRCMEASRLASAYILAQRSTERRETAALVAAVHEAVVTASADSYVFRADVKRSTERFEEIAVGSPVLEIQTRLRAEVHVLKSKIAQSQKASRSSSEALAKRIQSLETQLQEARQESSTDLLTGVANRSAFDRGCQEWLEGGLTRFSVLMVDVDDFKSINDNYGHFEGDRALAAVGAALRSAARAHQDVVARLGGDEFAILAKDLPLRAAEGLFARIIAALESHPPAEGAHAPRLTLSGGASEFSAGDTVRSLMQRADEALYEAKRRGKNRVATKTKPLLRDL